MEMTRPTHSGHDSQAAAKGLDWSQNSVLEAVLAAIRQCRPDKCVVLESRHLPEDRPGFAIQAE